MAIFGPILMILPYFFIFQGVQTLIKSKNGRVKVYEASIGRDLSYPTVKRQRFKRKMAEKGLQMAIFGPILMILPYFFYFPRCSNTYKK